MTFLVSKVKTKGKRLQFLMAKQISIISGILPGSTGVGEVLTHLLKEYNNKTMPRCRFFFRSGGLPIRRSLIEKKPGVALKSIASALKGELMFRSGFVHFMVKERSILIHPQSLGFQWCINFIEKSSYPVWIYLMDSSFFCVRSYNYIPGESAPCTRCIGGKFYNSKNYSCVPFPRNSPTAVPFVEKLIKYVNDNKVRLIVQNEKQAVLAKEHFGKNSTVNISGLWADDWNFDVDNSQEQKEHETPYDIAYHGVPNAAKGAMWLISLAKLLPKYKFLFPFAQTSAFSDAPRNCFFIEMSWNSGLREIISSAPLVIVPSLWSAPIEGALIKSLMLANATAAIRHPTAFVEEIPEDIILKIPTDINSAANIIESFFSGDISINKERRNIYIENLKRDNKNLLIKLLHIVNQQC